MTQRHILSGFVATAALIASIHGAAPAPVPAHAAAARCQTAQLAIAPDYGEAGVGHVGLIFLIHNRSGSSCTLFGYPGAQLLNASYRPLPTHVKWGSGYLTGNLPRRLVTLASGADAYFALEWVHIPTAGQSCPTAAFVQIIPPNATVSTIVWPGQGGIVACGGDLTTSPVEPTQFSFGVVPTS